MRRRPRLKYLTYRIIWARRRKMMIFLPSGGNNNGWNEEPFCKFILSAGTGMLLGNVAGVVLEAITGSSKLGGAIAASIMVVGLIIGVRLINKRK